MKKEIEVKFLQIDIENIRKKLKQSGAILVTPMRLMRRVMIKTPEMYKNNSFVRIRDEGDKVTMTYKQFNSQTIDGCDELEIIVNDFSDTVNLLKYAGLPISTYQESKREKWVMDGAEIVIDEWPWVKPYIEIEAPGEDLVRQTALKLGFKWENAVFGSVMRAYEAQYPAMKEKNILLSDIPQVKFEDKIPDVLKD